VPVYLVERQFEVGEEDMPAIGRRSRSLIEGQFPEITWHHSHVTLDERVFLVVQRARLLQDIVGDRELADVVEQATGCELA